MSGDRYLKSGAPKLLSDRAKVVVMGVVLGVLLIAYFVPTSAVQPKRKVIERPPVVDVRHFTPDPNILREIRDGTPLERGGGLKFTVWEHLMRKSYNIGAAAAQALKLPDEPASIAALRAQPQAYRGKYIWVKGRLEDFREEKMHPIPRARAFAGRLRTAAGDQVLFRVSQPLPQNVVDADEQWIRVEGFFVKIEDKHYVDQDDVLDAPLLIGPRVSKAFPDWHAVDKLDAKVLSRVKNAVWQDDSQTWRDKEDFRTLLKDSQDVPLWHIGAFAKRHFEETKDTDIKHTEIFELPEQYKAFKYGKYEQGAPLRLRGSFIFARVFQANPNPAGIQYWTEAWIRINRMGAKLIPIWIANDIGDWRFGEPVDIDGYFFKNYGYRVEEGGDRHTPLFVAGGMERFKMKSHPVVFWMGMGFAVIVLILAGLFFNMSRKSRRESDEYMKGMVERRQKRRKPAGVSPHAPLADE